MRQLMETGRPFPDSAARRHHFVPAFALARFADPPGSRKGWLTQLDVRSGSPQRTRPDDAAFEIDLYTYENRRGELSNTVEAFFSIVEKHASKALEVLRERPHELTTQQRETIAYFLVLQESRTPGGLARSERVRQAAFELRAGADLATLEGFQATQALAAKEENSPEDSEKIRRRMQRQLLEGRVGYEAARTGALSQIIDGIHDLAGEVYSLDWTVLTATEDEFITSDRPVSMVDLTPEFPWSGNAWKSSDGAISFYPLSPSKGLFMTPGACELSVAASDRARVRRLNLMTYGWAERFIFGTSQATVTRVKRQARQYPADVARRKSNKQVLLVPAEHHDPSIAAEYVRRGWPKGFYVEDDDGKKRLMSYVVVDLDGPAGTAAQAMTEIVEGFSLKPSLTDVDEPEHGRDT